MRYRVNINSRRSIRIELPRALRTSSEVGVVRIEPSSGLDPSVEAPLLGYWIGGLFMILGKLKSIAHGGEATVWGVLRDPIFCLRHPLSDVLQSFFMFSLLSWIPTLP